MSIASTPTGIRTLRGIYWMILGCASFAAMMASVRYIGPDLDAIEIVFVRAIVGLFMVVPIVIRSGPAALKTEQLPLHALRTILAFAAMVTLYYALAVTPLADSISLTFLIPLVTTLAAAFVLRENVDRSRWIATGVGFLGALVIVRPGVNDINPYIFLVILSCVFYAGTWSTIKILTRKDSAAITTFYMNILMVPLCTIPLFFVWKTPTVEQIIPLGVMALSGWLAHFCQARAFEEADTSAVMPFDFSRLVFGALFAWFLFDEVADRWVWTGALIVFAAGYFASRVEARRG
jgi:drug/metabolite transporter (DMT)-like permease